MDIDGLGNGWPIDGSLENFADADISGEFLLFM